MAKYSTSGRGPDLPQNWTDWPINARQEWLRNNATQTEIVQEIAREVEGEVKRNGDQLSKNHLIDLYRVVENAETVNESRHRMSQGDHRYDDSHELIVYSDASQYSGGSTTIGYYVETVEGTLVKAHGHHINGRSLPVAEHFAAKTAIDKVSDLRYDSVALMTDYENLVANLYDDRDAGEKSRELVDELQEILDENFAQWDVFWVPSELNKADELAKNGHK